MEMVMGKLPKMTKVKVYMAEVLGKLPLKEPLVLVVLWRDFLHFTTAQTYL